MIPLYAKTAGFVEPAEDVYYLVAADGVFLVDRSLLFTSVTPAAMVAGLEPVQSSLTLAIPRVPRACMEQIWGFFRAVWARWEGEAVAFLDYSPASRSYRPIIPPQRLSRYRSWGRWSTVPRVEYGHVPREQGWLRFGDVHSHGLFGAFFSCTDDRDDTQDGLRIVIGHVDRSLPDLRVSFIAHGLRFPLCSGDVIDEFADPAPPPTEWLDQVTVQTSENIPWGGYGPVRRR